MSESNTSDFYIISYDIRVTQNYIQNSSHVILDELPREASSYGILVCMFASILNAEIGADSSIELQVGQIALIIIIMLVSRCAVNKRISTQTQITVDDRSTLCRLWQLLYTY